MEAMFRTILVATDGSETGDRAVAFALGFARRHGTALILCSAVDRAAAIASCASPYGGINGGQVLQALDEAAGLTLDRASEGAARAGVPYTELLLYGHPAEAIVAAASRQADAIVVGTHGKHGLRRLILGSTAAAVLRSSEIPTFVVPPHGEPDHAPSGRILVAVDDSEPSDAALQVAMRWAEGEGGELLLCTAVDTRDPDPRSNDARRVARAMLAKREARVEEHDLRYRSIVVAGEPAAAIAATAASQGVDAIVIGTHGRRGLQRMFLGSVAEAVVRHATVPVAVIRTEMVTRSGAGRTELLEFFP